LADGGNAAKNKPISTATPPRTRKGQPVRVFPRELIGNASGAGSTLLAADLNKDCVMDIVTGNKLGTFYLLW
jgi:hypothetical protein